MANPDNINDPLLIIDRVNYPVVSDANAPQIGIPLTLATTRRSWLLCKAINTKNNAGDDIGLQSL